MEEQKLKDQLANALEIEPDQIMDYRQTEDGTYNVILFSFQKFTEVVPKEVCLIPPEYRKAYANPVAAKKSDLAALAELLGIEVEGELKPDYVLAIQEHKVQ